MRKNKSYVMLSLLTIIFMTITTWMITIMKGHMPYLDQWTRSFVETASGTRLYTMARWITELGSASFLIPFTIIMSFLLWWLFRDWLPAVIFSGGTLVSHLLNMLIKELIARERPRIYIAANAEGFSFPSGHSMITMVCYGFFMYLLTKRFATNQGMKYVQLLFVSLVFLIGMSRYIINVHYLTDIVAGFTFGIIILLGLIYLFEHVQEKRLTKNQS